jgi:hypothetical protein
MDIRTSAQRDLRHNNPNHNQRDSAGKPPADTNQATKAA